jgi:hypothetical protein
MLRAKGGLLQPIQHEAGGEAGAQKRSERAVKVVLCSWHHLIFREQGSLIVARPAIISTHVSGIGRNTQCQSRNETVHMLNIQPVAVNVGLRKRERLRQLEDDVADLALLAARALADSGERTDLDAVLQQLGYMREQLADIEG